MRFSQWDVVVGALDPITGSEQGGTRPLLIVSPNSINWSLTIATVLPLTTIKPGRKVYWTEQRIEAGNGGLKVDSLVMAHQIRTISQSRIVSRWGAISNAQVRDSILSLLQSYFKPDG